MKALLNGFHALRARSDNGIVDAIADLQDWVTNSKTGLRTEAAGAALASVKLALAHNVHDCLRNAYDAVTALMKDNSHTFGPDIPSNHRECNKSFRSVCEILQDRILERIRESRSKTR